jgi:hypothetical protein
MREWKHSIVLVVGSVFILCLWLPLVLIILRFSVAARLSWIFTIIYTPGVMGSKITFGPVSWKNSSWSTVIPLPHSQSCLYFGWAYPAPPFSLEEFMHFFGMVVVGGMGDCNKLTWLSLCDQIEPKDWGYWIMGGFTGWVHMQKKECTRMDKAWRKKPRMSLKICFDLLDE